ncbi:hypothetical protein G6L15_16200 [Agrobacterium rhizogenes]|uniref:hypothetical protein n=1 Tax=Rhizobium rhizogenes TaxID=359 RepID=UPI001571C784|nr:hypothetical protein [Rhizobium rhizogenes]NTG87695.1 hypothetical protein [Rhizobium rhizogenes]
MLGLQFASRALQPCNRHCFAFDSLAEASIEPSVGSPITTKVQLETINGFDKADDIYRHGAWRNFETVRPATSELVGWFNRQRPFESPRRTFVS